ncbi:hypothetical protein [Proteus terrae]|nr:hypothetical protein [Proteus terrae]
MRNLPLLIMSLFVSNGDNYIRINLACPRTIVKEGLERIKNAL